MHLLFISFDELKQIIHVFALFTTNPRNIPVLSIRSKTSTSVALLLTNHEWLGNLELIVRTDFKFNFGFQANQIVLLKFPEMSSIVRKLMTVLMFLPKKVADKPAIEHPTKEEH